MKRIFIFLIFSIILLLRISFFTNKIILKNKEIYKMTLFVDEGRAYIEKINDKYPLVSYYSKISDLENAKYKGYFLVKNSKDDDNIVFLELEKIKAERIEENFMKKYLNNIFERAQNELSFRAKNINKAILLGENKISKEMKTKIRYLGLSHIFAMSGLHIALVFMLIYSLAFRILNKKKYIEITVLIFLSIYFLSVKESPSFTRAYIMLFILVLGKMLYEKVNLKKLIYVSMYISIFIKPNSFASLSFQLSYLAIFAIAYIYPIIRKINIKKYKILDYILFTLSIQIFLIPIQVYYFDTIPFLSIIYNLVLAPIGTFYITLNYLMLFLENFYLGFVLFYPIKWMANIFLGLIDIFSAFPYSTLNYYNQKLIYFYVVFFIIIFLKNIKDIFYEKI